MHTDTATRRTFLSLCAGVLSAVVLPSTARARSALPPVLTHPEPRKGYTAAKVMKASQLTGNNEGLIPLFDGVREIPQILDGIRCSCGCAEWEGIYSLLSCYEGESAMALWCPICQGRGRLATRLAKQGKTLKEIRAAVDARGDE